MSAFKSSDLPPTVSLKPPHVLIAGAGIGGLMLAIILEKTDITYEIFEKSKEIKPLGSTMCLNPTVMPAFEQLGLYEDLLEISHPVSTGVIRNADAKIESFIDSGDNNETAGYEYALLARARLYELLLSKVPAEKIIPGKRVVSFLQNKEGVMVRFQDRTTIHGDILVGADGTYSSVRQHLFKELNKMGKLPKSDQKLPTSGHICMVGYTIPFDPETCPELKRNRGHTDVMISNKSPWSWNTTNLRGHIVAWSASRQLNSEEFAYEHLKNSEWSPEMFEPLVKEVSDFKTPYGALGSLIEATPKECISRVFLEKKFFETWTYSRTVLIGDGAVNAIQDAIILANCIYEMRENSYDAIVTALTSYREQQYDYSKTQYESSKFNGKVFYGHTIFDRALRHILANYLPPSARAQSVAKIMAYRPQIAFLPLIPNRGTAEVESQKPSAKYLEQQAWLANAVQAT
ncbi:hypothetical protein BGX20_008060 [Mortierella sp. AD010]|nr:hypothetical protein BGX20_008060 [Mortierella sp. AD010]